MIHPQTLVKGAYEAFGRGDIPAVLSAFAEDIRWHVPGRSRLSGDYRRHAGVLEFFRKCAELSEGTLKIDVHDLVASDTHVFALCTVSAMRKGQRSAFLDLHLWRVSNDRIVEFREFQGDEETETRFWS